MKVIYKTIFFDTNSDLKERLEKVLNENSSYGYEYVDLKVGEAISVLVMRRKQSQFWS